MKHSERDFVKDASAGAMEFELEPPALPFETEESTSFPEGELDMFGLPAPLVILRLNRALRDLDSGAIVKLRCDTPGAAEDFQAFSQVTGNSVKAESEYGVYTVRRK